ncbi:threonine-tRNA ligase [Pneumocystis jirovecii RU7]|nr:threonine-tRNA ligase [Pneumocystis jirovecii RU7]KTW31316.1 threonine-tRNA ligase [Pneumocystis jirovecii RU7]
MTLSKNLNAGRLSGLQKVKGLEDLLMTSDVSPGSIFMLPYGTRIYNKLVEFMRIQCKIYGYQEVRSPMIYKKSLWKKSGHWENYKNEMFEVIGQNTAKNNKKEIGNYFQDETYGLKPMNCPGHCLIYSSKERSYRDLPIRYTDFGTLHRNEPSGSLSGLTRLRQFHQDDAHIFCRQSQIFDEISSILDIIKTTYSVLKFPSYEYSLSTRPSKFVGTLEDWEKAEEILKHALNAKKQQWFYNEKDGAFYGPKIDLLVTDKNGKKYQMATIQLDFQLPLRFQLKYRSPVENDLKDTSKGASVMKTPVIIHRAIFGSIERMMALLLEYTEGQIPFWLSPRQAIIIPIGGKNIIEYANDVYYQISGYENNSKVLQTIHKRIFYVDLDLSQRTLAKMIREAWVKAYNFIIIIGDKELKTKTVSVRSRDGKKQEIMQPKDVYNMFTKLEASYE